MTSVTTRARSAGSARAGWQGLDTAAVVFTMAVLLHNADHLRQGTEHVSGGVFWLGTTAVFAEVAVVALIASRHRLAPIAAAVVGATLAAGYLTVHFLPDLGWFSDSFTSARHVSPLSWVAATVEVLAALALAGAGAATVSRDTRDGRGPAPRSWRESARQPLAISMAAGNTIVLVVSAVQRWHG